MPKVVSLHTGKHSGLYYESDKMNCSYNFNKLGYIFSYLFQDWKRVDKEIIAEVYTLESSGNKQLGCVGQDRKAKMKQT